MTTHPLDNLEARKAALLKRKAQIEARIQALEARGREKARKADTRRKIILGGYVLAAARTDKDARRLIADLIASLEKPADRALFADLLNGDD